MKKRGVLNDRLSLLIAQMGHTDRLAIADCGLPIPATARRIDLAVTKGIPAFIDTVRAILSEFDAEEAIMAEEAAACSPGLVELVREALDPSVAIRFICHEDFKAMLPGCKAVVRTGECTPYANILLSSTVHF